MRTRLRLQVAGLGFCLLACGGLGRAGWVGLRSGDILAANYGANSVLKIDADSGVVQTLGDFVSPTAVALAPNGDLYVSEWGGLIHRLALTTGTRTVVNPGTARFAVWGLVLHPGGDLIVTCGADDSIVRIDPATGVETVISAAGNLLGVSGIALLDPDHVVVCSSFNDSIVIVALAGGAQTAVTTSGGGIDFPRGVAVFGSDLFVTALDSRELRRVPASGGAVATFYTSTGVPFGMDAWTDGSLVTGTSRMAAPGSYVHSILRVSAAGALLHTYSDPLISEVTGVALSHIELAGPSNHAPVLDAIGARAVDELAALVFTVTAADPNDVPANALTLSATGLPAGASFTPATGVFSWTPTEAQQGSYTVTFTVTDDGTPNLSASELVTLTVNGVNHMPSFTSGGNQTVAEDAAAQTVPGWATAIQDGNPEVVQALTFTLTTDNHALFAVLPAASPATGDLVYTPAANANGSATVSVTLTDDATAGGTALTTAVQTFTITVTPVNDPPNNTVAPSVSGTHAAGQTLTAADGTWDDRTDQAPGALTQTRRWRRADDASGRNAAAIAGASASAYTLAAADVGTYVCVEVTATDDGEGTPPTRSTSASSAWTLVGAALPSPAPTGVDLLAASDTGLAATDDITRLANGAPATALALNVGGTAAGATVRVYADGAPIGSAVAAGATTTVTTDGTTTLVDGARVITATQTEPGMDESPASPALTVTIDTTAPVLQSAVSRQTHGAAGTFDLVLPIATPWGIECRLAPVCTLSLVFGFSEVVHRGDGFAVTVTSGTAAAGPTDVASNTLTLGLAGVADVQWLALRLNPIEDAAGNGLDLAYTLGILAGDVTLDGTVSAQDFLLVRDNSLQPLDQGTNFRYDIDSSGAADAQDARLARYYSLHALTLPWPGAPVSDLYVDDDGTDANPGTSPAVPMQSLQALLDRYPDIGVGYVVHLAPGVYPGNVHLGGNHGGLVIAGAGDGADPATATHLVGQGGSANLDVLLVTAGGPSAASPTTVRSLRVASPGGQDASREPNAPIYAGITLDATPGRRAKPAGGGLLQYVHLIDVTATAVTGQGTGCGILVTGSSAATDVVSDVILDGCTASGNGYAGILLADTQVTNLSLGGALPSAIWQNGGSGLVLRGPLHSGAAPGAPLAIANTSFYGNHAFDIELQHADRAVDATADCVFVGAATLTEIEPRLWHHSDDPALGLVSFGAPALAGNRLTWNPSTQSLTLNGATLSPGEAWYDLGVPVGAQAQIRVVPRTCSLRAVVNAIDLTGGDHADALAMVDSSNELYFRWTVRKGALSVLAEASVLQQSTVLATWAARRHATVARRAVSPGIWLYGHLILTPIELIRQYAPP